MPCPGPFLFPHIAEYIYDICPLPDPDVSISILVCDVERNLSFVLLVSVHVYSPYAIAGSTHFRVVHLSLQADVNVAFEVINKHCSHLYSRTCSKILDILVGIATCR